MKFSSTVEALSRENMHLRRLLLILGVALIGLSMGVVLLYDKAPMVVERSSRGLELVRMIPLRQTPADIQEGVRLMLKARLDTDSVSPDLFLNADQLGLRDQEQRDLKSKGFTQAVLVDSITLSSKSAFADLDRVIRVGNIRSALRTRVSLTFEEVEPNELNPYGLKLASLTPIEMQASENGAAPIGTGGGSTYNSPSNQNLKNPGVNR